MKVLAFITLILLVIPTMMAAPAPHLTTSIHTTSINTSRQYVTEYNLTGVGDIYDIANIGDMVYITQYNTSILWEYNTSSNQLSSHTFPVDITPLLMNKAPDNSLWFLDYDYTPQDSPLDHIVRFDPVTGNTTYFDLPRRAHAVNFGVSNGYAWTTILNQDKIVLVNITDYSNQTLKLPCHGGCGPVGAGFDSSGNLWINAVVSNQILKYSFTSHNYTLYPGLENFPSATYIVFANDDTYWTGSHAGDKLAHVNTTDMSYKIYTSPQPNRDQYPASGVNDIALMPNGDVWFTEHFLNRMGKLDRASGTIQEYYDPRPLPYTANLNRDGNKIWYAETYGIFSYFDTTKVPTVAIGKISNQTIDSDPSFSIDLPVTYKSGILDSITFSVFGEVRRWYAFDVSTTQDTYTLQRGESQTIPVKIKITGKIDADLYTFVVGIKTDTFSATQQFYLRITQNWDRSGNGNFQWYDVVYILLPIVIIAELYMYREDIANFIAKRKKKNNE